MRKKKSYKKKSSISTVDKLINYVMWDGEKRVAKKIVNSALELVEKETKIKWSEVLELAINNVKPKLNMKKKRVGGTVQQVPEEVRPEEGLRLALKKIVKAARNETKKKSRGGAGKPMFYCLFQEINNASKKQGEAYKNTERDHKQAIANFVFVYNPNSKKIFS